MENLIIELEATYKKANEIKEKIRNEHGAIRVSMDHEDESYSIELQYSDEVFFDKFNNFTVSERKDTDYPFRVTSKWGNVTNFTILTQQEYESYIKSGVLSK